MQSVWFGINRKRFQTVSHHKLLMSTTNSLFLSGEVAVAQKDPKFQVRVLKFYHEVNYTVISYVNNEFIISQSQDGSGKSQVC